MIYFISSEMQNYNWINRVDFNAGNVGRVSRSCECSVDVVTRCLTTDRWARSSWRTTSARRRPVTSSPTSVCWARCCTRALTSRSCGCFTIAINSWLTAETHTHIRSVCRRPTLPFTAYISPLTRIVCVHRIDQQQYADDSQLFISVSPSSCMLESSSSSSSVLLNWRKGKTTANIVIKINTNKANSRIQ